jgi:peptide/nickel transport system substrate-binding protein
MSRGLSIVVFLLLVAFIFSACNSPKAPTHVVVKETVSVTVKETVEVPVQVVVTTTPAPTPTPKRGNTLIIGRAEDVSGLDPHKQSSSASLRAIELIYDPLFTFDKDMKIVPDLAEAWKWSDDGKTITISLRKNVRFHNGDPLTADDVKFSLERIMDDKTLAAMRAFFLDIDKIEATDTNTVTIRLKRVNSAILAALAQPNAAIVSKKFVSSGGAFNKESGGTGMFKLSKWDPGRSLVLSANKDYWMPGLPRIDGIEFRVAGDDTAVLAGLRSKSFDFGLISDWRVGVRAGAGNSALTIARSSSLTYHALMLNASRRTFSDVRVRQAVGCAIDRQEVLDMAALGEGEITGPATPPYYRANFADLNCYQKNWEKARQLLTDAGRASGLRFKLTLPSDDSTVAAEAQNIQSQLRKAGVESDLEVLEPGVFIDRWNKADFDAALTSSGGYPDPDIMLAPYWQSTGDKNRIANYRDPELDKLFDQGRTTVEPEKRKPIYDLIQKKLVEASPWIWLYSGYDYRVMQSYVKGYTPSSNGSLLSLRDIWLEK